MAAGQLQGLLPDGLARSGAGQVQAFADRSTPDLATILELDAEARRMTLQLLKGMQ